MINKSLAVIKNIWKKRVYASHSNDLFNCLCLSHIFSLIWKNLTCVLVFNVVIFICNNKMTTGTVFQEWSAFHKSLSPSILFLIFVFDIIKNIERNFIFLLIFAPLFLFEIFTAELSKLTQNVVIARMKIYTFSTHARFAKNIVCRGTKQEKHSENSENIVKLFNVKSFSFHFSTQLRIFLRFKSKCSTFQKSYCIYVYVTVSQVSSSSLWMMRKFYCTFFMLFEMWNRILISF
jgi:hypothetical protein